MLNYMVYLTALYHKHANLSRTKLNMFTFINVPLPLNLNLPLKSKVPSIHTLTPLGSTVQANCTPIHLMCAYTNTVYTPTYTALHVVFL